ncbi:hypothetical protein A1Q2_00313 [Trichosporon asahii var. asahii CBS 8904]|uniref:Uncharacterized protein n=1 Tax=Trichosporon asahii var. asahii (strain CBS 8904) TaxID=1220162 RepID=K1W0N7_TRIAC|nr:hypothetical protein A1Q2_00313 [Trichosporon asahii var. asahii CBS 8904]
MGSLQRALKAHQARLDALTRDVGELSERSERDRDLARDIGQRAREISRERNPHPAPAPVPVPAPEDREKTKYTAKEARGGMWDEERRWGDDNYAAFALASPTSPCAYDGAEIRIGDIVRGPIHSRSASETATHSRSASVGYDPASVSDPGHGAPSPSPFAYGPGLCSTAVSRSGSAAGTYPFPQAHPSTQTHSRNNSQNAPYAPQPYAPQFGQSLGVNTSTAPGYKESFRPTTPGFDDMEVLTSSDPFAAPLPGGKRGGLVAPLPHGLRPGDLMTPPPSHSNLPYTPPPSHTPTPSNRQDSDSPDSLRDRRHLRQLEARLATLEAHIGLVPGQTPTEPSMDQRLVRLEMSVGQMIESSGAMPADSMYDPIFDSVYQD